MDLHGVDLVWAIFPSVDPKQFVCRAIWFRAGLRFEPTKVEGGLVEGGWWWVVVVPQKMQNDPWHRHPGALPTCREITGFAQNCCSRIRSKFNILKSEIPAAGQTRNQRLANHKWQKSGKYMEIQSQKWKMQVQLLQVGDKCRIMRAKNPECSRKRVGEVWKTSVKSCEPKHSEHRECIGRQVGDKPEIMRSENPECLWQETSPATNVKSCGPSMRSFQRTKNPSQVNLFKEKSSNQCSLFALRSFTDLFAQGIKTSTWRPECLKVLSPPAAPAAREIDRCVACWIFSIDFSRKIQGFL